MAKRHPFHLHSLTCDLSNLPNMSVLLTKSSRDSLAPDMDWDGNPEHEEPTGTIDDDIWTIQRNMTPARKYFSHSQSTNNKLVLDPELKFLYHNWHLHK